MPGLDVNSLSSNWKKLQQTLKAAPKRDAAGDQGVKRKWKSDTYGGKSDDPNNPNLVNVSNKRVKSVTKTETQKTSQPKEKKEFKAKERKEIKPKDKNKMGATFSSSSSIGEKASATTTTAPSEAKAGAVSSGRPSFAGSTETLVNQGLHPTHKPGKFLALDCEMVGTGPPPASDNVLARVSIVNFHGEQVYDSYVQPVPGVEVTDYRTFVSGIRPEHLEAEVARPFAEVQKEVSDLLDGKVLVGHALKNDLTVLLLAHPQRDIRDTARHANFRKLSMGRSPALRKLAKERLGLEIQGGEHSSVEDARATMLLFKLEKDVFEKEVQQRYGPAMRRERRTKEAEAKQAMKALPGQMADESDTEDEEDEDELEEELDDDGNLVKAKGPAGRKKKNKKKKRTKRA